MILGFLSDAHGNPDALARCVRALEASRVERLYFLGDAVGYLPFDNEVLALLHEKGAIPVRGNHDAMLLGDLELCGSRDEVYRITAARARLESRWRAWLETWPRERAFEIDGVRFFLVHGSPSDPLGGYIYPDADLAPFHNLAHDVVLLGQTHRPFVAQAGPVTVINVGSSGLPRDVGNLASCVVYDTASREAEVLRVPFDAEGMARQLEGRIAPSVTELLRRESPGTIVGRTVALKEEPRLTTCVFAWDEVATLRSVVESHLAVLARLTVPYELVIIDDGSTDGTAEEADRLANEHGHIQVVHHAENRGLGGVYRTAFQEARGTFVTFYPADDQFPATLIERFYPLAEDWDLLLGTLPKRRDSLLGAALGRMERLLYRAAFGVVPRLEGVFMVRRTLLEEIHLKSEGRGWAVVWELVLRAQRQGYRITGVPVELRPRTHGVSKVSNLRTIAANLRQLIQLRRLL